MLIKADKLGKKFNREWIFKNFSQEFNQGAGYALTGPNGSGKTTLLHVLMGMLPPSRGKLQFYNGPKEIEEDDFYSYQTLAAPYLELVEELTLDELLDFHFSFKKISGDLNFTQVKTRAGLEKAGKKQIKYFSSGMKQRLKLGLAFFSDVPVLLLDEPCSNLDKNGVAWYKEEIANLRREKLIIVGSNQPYEYEFVDEVIHLESYKN